MFGEPCKCSEDTLCAICELVPERVGSTPTAALVMWDPGLGYGLTEAEQLEVITAIANGDLESLTE